MYVFIIYGVRTIYGFVIYAVTVYKVYAGDNTVEPHLSESPYSNPRLSEP